jgi:hypothetical protein
MFNKIKDYLFGQIEVFNDDLVGKLTARIKNRNPSINYTWVGEHLLSGQKKPTVFIMEGNSAGPYKDQLISTQSIVKSFTEIEEDICSNLKSQEGIKPRFISNWTSDFFISAIVPNTQNEGSFEIIYEPVDPDDLDCVSCVWKNGQLTKIEGK